jgi:hypothetical protein
MSRRTLRPARFVPLKAHQIQPPDDPARAEAERAEAGLARAIREGLAAFADSISPAEVTRLLAVNDFRGLWDHLAFETLGDVLRPALGRIAVIHDRTARIETDWIVAGHVGKAAPSRLRTPDVIRLTYDPLDNATVNAQRAAAQATVQRIETGTDATAQRIVTTGLAQRRSTETIARDLRASLGLTQRESDAIQAYRRALEGGGRSGLNRALRDPRYDAGLRRAADRGEVLDQARIDRMVQRYADRYRAFRADTIARTEAMQAANDGRRDAWRQYIDRTGRDGTEVRRFWLTAGDELVCPVCRAIPVWNEFGVPMDGTYDTPDGPMDGPLAHPLCRCSERYERVDSTDTLPVRPPLSIGVRIILEGLDAIAARRPEPAEPGRAMTFDEAMATGSER